MKDHSTTFPTPTSWLDRLAVRLENWEECEGVPLAIGSFRNEATIRTQIGNALRLLGAYAPADFARLRRLMRGIIVGPLHGAHAQWRQSLHACVISTAYLKEAHASPQAIAATIIHELTHARLRAVGFDYREERRARIERICARASKGFLERLPASPERDAAIEEVTLYLSLPDNEWSNHTLEREWRQHPWYVRVLRFLLRRLPSLWHRRAPT